MITCQHARHLFDRYLDGELSPSLQAELHAHQLSCGDCQGELALLESCGDVIAYDRCEPVLSASFTDRVLLAQRAQARPAPRRNWSRTFISIASPLAAAACVALAVTLISPGGSQPQTGLVASYIVQPSQQNISVLSGGEDKVLGETKGKVHQMAPGFVDVVLDPMVRQTRNTVDSTKRSFEQLQSLFGLGVAGAHNTLAAGRRSLESVQSPAGATVAPKASGLDIFAPLPPSEAPLPDTPSSLDLDDTIEAL